MQLNKTPPCENRDIIKLIQSPLTNSTTRLWRRRNQRRNNAILEGDESLDGDDLIEWGQGKENSYLFKEEDGSTIIHVLDYYFVFSDFLLPLAV